MSEQEVTVRVPSGLWMTSNRRMHWAARHRRTVDLLRLTKSAVHSARLRRVDGPVVVTWWIGYPPGVGRADPSNAHTTTKVVLDGIVSAGVLVDDDSRHVIDGGHRRGESSGRRGWYVVTAVITPDTVVR